MFATDWQKAFSLFSHFPITHLFTNRKKKTLKTPLTAVVANALVAKSNAIVAKSNAMVAKSTVVAAEWNKVFGFSLKNVYYFIK